MPVKVREIHEWLESRFPEGWAEGWDHVGLQLGDPEKPVERTGISLEAAPRSVSWAVQKNLHLLICHHPLFFNPITSLRDDREPGRTASQMIKAEVCLLVAHTNLDAAPEGVSTALGRRLGLMDLIPLEKRSQDQVKLVLFVPVGYEEKIMKVLDAFDAGRIGSYRLCTFKSRGEGTFVPEKGSSPFMGEPGRMERASEWRLEVTLLRTVVPELIMRLRPAHPYEEMAFDVYPLENLSAGVGLGRVGRFEPPIEGEALIRRLKEDIEAPWVRVSGTVPPVVKKVAVCGGSGGSLIAEALSARAEIFICGEIGYHPVVSQQGGALTLIEIGHYPSEKWVIPMLAESLREASRSRGWGLEVLEDQQPGDPYSQYF
jgi:dinuclear metal center YbgI/SA1388 family protein